MQLIMQLYATNYETLCKLCNFMQVVQVMQNQNALRTCAFRRGSDGVVMRIRVWLNTALCNAYGVQTQLVLRQDCTVLQTAGAVVCDSRPGAIHPCRAAGLARRSKWFLA